MPTKYLQYGVILSLALASSSVLVLATDLSDKCTKNCIKKTICRTDMNLICDEDKDVVERDSKCVSYCGKTADKQEDAKNLKLMEDIARIMKQEEQINRNSYGLTTRADVPDDAADYEEADDYSSRYHRANKQRDENKLKFLLKISQKMKELELVKRTVEEFSRRTSIPYSTDDGDYVLMGANDPEDEKNLKLLKDISQRMKELQQIKKKTVDELMRSPGLPYSVDEGKGRNYDSEVDNNLMAYDDDDRYVSLAEEFNDGVILPENRQGVTEGSLGDGYENSWEGSHYGLEDTDSGLGDTDDGFGGGYDDGLDYRYEDYVNSSAGLEDSYDPKRYKRFVWGSLLGKAKSGVNPNENKDPNTVVGAVTESTTASNGVAGGVIGIAASLNGHSTGHEVQSVGAVHLAGLGATVQAGAGVNGTLGGATKHEHRSIGGSIKNMFTSLFKTSPKQKDGPSDEGHANPGIDVASTPGVVNHPPPATTAGIAIAAEAGGGNLKVSGSGTGMGTVGTVQATANVGGAEAGGKVLGGIGLGPVSKAMSRLFG